MESVYERREMLLHNEILSLMEQLKEKTTAFENLKLELEAANKRLESEKIRYKQSSEDLKKRNKELTVKNEELSKELHVVKNLNASDKNFDNSGNASKFQESDINKKTKKELDDLRSQQVLDQNTIQKLKRKLEESGEKIVDLENVLEVHQLEIEEHKKELKSQQKQDKETKPPSKATKKKSKNMETTDIIKMLELLEVVKKNAIDFSNYLNSNTTKDKRTNFDEQILQLKNENNALIESITVVKLTTRSFETTEKELTRIRTQNNQTIKTTRKQVQDIIAKVNTLYNQFTKIYPQNLRSSMEQCTKDLDELIKIKIDHLYKTEEALQEEIIKKLENEKEFLTTVLSKQDVI